MKPFEILTLIISVLAIIASLVSIFINTYLKHNIDTKLVQYNLTNEEQSNAIKGLFELELYLDELLAKYDTDATTLLQKITPDEKLKINTYISRINLALTKLFIITPDEKYKHIDTEWPLGAQELKNLREKISILLRTSQFPDTEYNEAKNIKLIYKVK